MRISGHGLKDYRLKDHWLKHYWLKHHWLKRQIARGLVLLLVAPLVAAATSPQKDRIPSRAASASSAQTRYPEPDSGDKKLDAEASQPPETLPDSPGTMRSQTVDDKRQVSGEQPLPQQQQNSTQEPVGTAAAPVVKATGVAASQPAGAAMAPAKQRRARSILIKVGAIVGAGAAIGTVAALSSASPSRPSH